MKRTITHNAELSERIAIARKIVYPYPEVRYSFFMSPRNGKGRAKKGICDIDSNTYYIAPRTEHSLAQMIMGCTDGTIAPTDFTPIEGEGTSDLLYNAQIGEDSTPLNVRVTQNKLGRSYLLLRQQNPLAPEETTITPLSFEEAAALGNFIRSNPSPTFTR